MSHLHLDLEYIHSFVSSEELSSMSGETSRAMEKIRNKSGAGNDFLGWVDLPEQIKQQDLDHIRETAENLRREADTLVVTGIGGSYLGARAVIEALTPAFQDQAVKSPEILYAGNQLSADYMGELLEYLENRNFGIVVISKSGTTTEPAIAFRFLKDLLEKKAGKKAASRRIIAITDARKGALLELAGKEGYQRFVIPDDIGGRFSVLTPVGLVPIALAGLDIKSLVEGAREMMSINGAGFEQNPAAQYAALRNILYRKGKKIEILVNYDPRLHFFSEWWKQLFGESEGKDGKGIYPSSADFTTDLHSLGQYIQEGERHLFETVLSVQEPEKHPVIKPDPDDLDHLNYIAGKDLDFVNKQAQKGTLLAHVDGGVPNIRVEIGKRDARHLGHLIYFFEMACAISGYLLDVNPFNQPGVEAYKKNMFSLLGKPGYSVDKTE